LPNPIATTKLQAAVAPAATEATPSAPTPDESAIPEAVGTRRMYGAHAPLRTPAVANPDSEQNRRILQTMVTKALVRSSEVNPAATNK
jgi:hypothetical protein